MKSAAPGRQSWALYSGGRQSRQPDSGAGREARNNADGLQAQGFWHTGQKKVERPDWTMRLTVPRQPGVWQGWFSRS